MCGDHTVCAHRVEPGEHSFGDGAACGRFSAAAELVDQHERGGCGVREYLPHVLQMGTVRAQVVLQRLVVADVDEDAVKDHHLADLRRGDEHTPLEHILQQTYRLEAHRLASGVRSGYQQDVLLAGKRERERNDLLLLAAERGFQQRMPGPAQVQFSFLRKDRHAGDHVECDQGLGTDEVDLADILGGGNQAAEVRPEELREFEEDAGDLALFLELKLADLVAQFDDFQRLDEGRLAAGRLVVHDAGQFLLRAGRHGDEYPPVADHYFGIALHQPFALRGTEDGVDAPGNLPLLRPQAAPDLTQGGRSRVAHLSVTVENRFDAAPDGRIATHRSGNLPERGIKVILAVLEESQDPAQRIEAHAQEPERR